LRITSARSVKQSSPSTRSVPALGRSTPISMRIVVVLPVPLGPSSAYSSPGRTASVMSRTASNSP
jgi:hypothetical protein